MSKIEVNAIEPQCGTTLTIGASDTSIAGIGTVNWDTTKKTAAFTAVSGRGYFVDTTSAAITVTMPATPSAGDIVAISDYNGTAITNAITLARNGSNINGDASDYIITNADSAVTFVYVDATVGWTSVQTSNTTDTQNPFIIATGGTITECGNFRIHTFTGPGTFSVTQAATNSAENTVGYLVVAGGAAGGTGGTSVTGGGGGAGGYREGRNVPIDNFTASPLVANAPTNAVTIAAGDYPITVGAGGASVTCDSTGNPGSNSIFSTITSAGGGGGGGNAACEADGGSGGGGKESDGPGGAGNTPPVSPPQGQNGGPGNEAANSSGGGGGAGAAGGATPGGGGAGVSTSITGSSVTRAGGGASNDGSGGSGGGGDSGGSPSFPIPSIGNGQAGTANTGGGGGGAIRCNNSGAGGSGIVIIRYKYQ